MTLVAMQEHESVTLEFGPFDYRRQGLIRLILDHVGTGKVLDMRCLEGELVAGLLKKGCSVYGLDGFQGAIVTTMQNAQEHGLAKEQLQLWDIKNIPAVIGDQQFDWIICSDLLNHVEDDGVALEQINRILAPGGKVIFIVPAFPFLLGQRDKLLGHLRRYTKTDFKSRLQEHGFTALKLRYWNTLALPGYILIEKFFRRTLTDYVRYRGAKHRGIFSPLLRFWYRSIERLLCFPCGLSLFAVVQKA